MRSSPPTRHCTPHSTPRWPRRSAAASLPANRAPSAGNRYRPNRARPVLRANRPAPGARGLGGGAGARATAGARHDKAAKAHERATAAAVKAAAQASAAIVERDRAAAALDEAESVVRTTEAELAATQSALVDQLGDGDPAALLDERQAELREADAVARAAAERERAARDTLDTARRRAGDATARVATVRERLAAAWGALGADAPDVDVAEAAARLRRL